MRERCELMTHRPMRCVLPKYHAGMCKAVDDADFVLATPEPPMTPVCPCLAQSGYLCQECRQLPEEPTPAPGLLDFEVAKEAGRRATDACENEEWPHAYKPAFCAALNAQAAALAAKALAEGQVEGAKAERERIVKMLRSYPPCTLTMSAVADFIELEGDR